MHNYWWLMLISLAIARRLPTISRPFKSSRQLQLSLSTGIDQTMSILLPKSDTRQYKYVVLKNGIRTLLVSDPRSEKSACALGVEVGAAKDTLPGLAHMTEHAVFLGSEKYPQENAYKDFLNKNGGGSNGGTGMEQTVYKFYVNSNAFSQALDIFAQFFIRPLFLESSIAREVHAVDAEDNKNRMLDFRRQLQLIKHLMRPNITEYKKFSTGNIITLAGNDTAKNAARLSEEIRDFHQNYYRPDNMALSMVGPQSLEELEKLCEIFAEISGSSSSNNLDASNSLKNAASHTKQLSQPPSVEIEDIFRVGKEKVVVMHTLSQSVRELNIYIPLPYSQSASYYTVFTTLFSYLLTHKTPSSLFSYLQEKGWVTAMRGGSRFISPPDLSLADKPPAFVLYEVSLSLTEDGWGKWHDVQQLVWGYIEKIQRSPQEEIRLIYQDLYSLSKLGFHYAERESPYEYAPNLVHNMLDSRGVGMIDGGSLLPLTYPEEYVRVYLQGLRRDNCLYMLRAHKGEFEKIGSQSAVKEQIDSSFIPENDIGLQTMSSLLLEDESQYLSKVLAEKSSVVSLDAVYDEALTGFRGLLTVLEDEEEKGVKGVDIYTEPYYGVQCAVAELKKLVPIVSDHSATVSSFSLPPLNPYICTSLSQSLPDQANPPTEDPSAETKKSMVLRSSKPYKSRVSLPQAANDSSQRSLDVYVSRDEVFDSVKTVAYLHLPLYGLESWYPVDLSVLSSMLGQVCMQKFYLSSVAGLNYDITLSNRGLTLKVSGFSEKLPVLLDQLTSLMTNRSFWKSEILDNEQLYKICLDRVTRSLQSWKKERPDQQAGTLLSYILHTDTHYPLDLLAYAEGGAVMGEFMDKIRNVFCPSELDGRLPEWQNLGNELAEVPNNIYTDIRARSPILYLHTPNITTPYTETSSYIQSSIKAVQGLLRQAPADELPVSAHSTSVYSTLCHQVPRDSYGVVALPAYNDQESNSALVMYFQADRVSARNMALILIIRRLYSEPAFTCLRTQKQLGYIVSFGTNTYGRGRNGIKGLELRVLSKQHSPLSIHKHCVDFLLQHKSAHIDTLESASLVLMTNNIIKSLVDPLNSVFEEGSVYWQEILYDLDYYGFQVDEVVAALKEVSVSEVQAACQGWLYGASGNNGGAKRLSVLIFGNKHKEEFQSFMGLNGNEELVTSTGEFFVNQKIHVMRTKEEIDAFIQGLDVYQHYKD